MLARPSKIVLDPTQVDLSWTAGDGRERAHLATRVMDSRNGHAVVLVAFAVKARGGWRAPEYRMLRLSKREGLWKVGQRFNLRAHHLRAFGGQMALFESEVAVAASTLR